MSRQFLSVVFACLISWPVHGQQPFLKYYTIDQGFPHAQVWDVCQDRQGFLWFATGGGLVRYNGVTYTVYGKDDGLVSNIIRGVVQDDDGKMWVTSDDGVTVFDGETFENYTSRDGLGEGFVWKTIKDRQGRYWFPTSSSGIYCFDGRSFRKFEGGEGVREVEWRTGHMDRRGNLWFGGNAALVVLRYRDGRYDDRFQAMPKNRVDALGAVNHVTSDHLGRLLLCTSKGLAVADMEGYDQRPEKGLQSFATWYTIQDGLPDSRVQSAIEASDSTIWVTTERGFAHIKGGLVESFQADEDRSSNSMHVVMEDREGTLWIGTDGGGCLAVPHQNIRNYTVRDGLSARVVNAVTGDLHGRVYVGTDNGVDVVEHGILRPLKSGRFLAGDPVWSLKIARDGTLWIGSRGRLMSYAGGQLTDHKAVFSRLASPILDIEEDDTGRLWLATLDGISVVEGTTITAIGRSSGLPGGQVWCVYRDRQGVMWAGVNGGLVRLRHAPESGSWIERSFTATDGLVDNTVNVIRQDRKGLYWVGTDMGISRFDGTTFFNIKAKQLGLGDNIVPVIEVDPYENAVWIGSKGYVLLDADTLPPTVVRRINKGRGMVGDETTTNNSFHIDREGGLWIGTFSGLTHFTERRTGIAAPIVRIEAMRIGDSTVNFNSLVDDRPGPLEIHSAAVSFTFAALSFLNERENLFQYRLDGFEDRWSELTPMNEVRYTNLSPGVYTLSVRARNSEMVFSVEPATLTFTVARPAWLHPLFILFIVALFFGGIYGAHRLRVIRKMELMNRRTRELEEKVRERTAELIRQKNELEDILDKLRRTQGQLVQSEKMAALGQLVAGVAHEINNPTSILAGNVNYIEEYMRILKSLIAKYEELPVQDTAFASELDSLKKHLDWDFVQTDIDSLLASVKNAADRIRHIVLDLRNFSRLDEAEINEVDIHECIDTTVKLFMNQYRHVLTIDRDFRATSNVFCYVNQLNQVLLNLLINAAQAIEKKSGEIKDGNFSGRITIATQDTSDRGVVIRIRDNGCGIEKAFRDRIFDPFFTTKPVGQGTGLGLSISYAIIVEKHNGSLTFDSQPGEWTEFAISLPHKPHEIPS